ncbi:MAG: acyl-CoA dehydrogenase [Gammaproteobacteria bacterium]|nr:acyl-CoA dehydrogenase [Gammaproteobacteria bacterium]
MSEYTAPIAEMRFLIERLCNLGQLTHFPRYAEVTIDLVEAVLQEAGKLASEILAPLNRSGDREGAKYHANEVTMPTGWQDAYQKFIDGGWNGLPFAAAHGGQGLPKVLATAVSEMWNTANLSFALGPMLTAGAAEAIEHHGSAAQRALFLEKLVTGAWTGTMNLTEPQAGSDLSTVRTRATPEGAHYRIVGQKIFITYGEHDLTENIIHLVLARLPDTPAGTRGLSLFIVPKILVNADGSLGARNDVRCASLEHKLGIHGSPTAVMVYGEAGGAIGYLIGAPNRGLEYMFTMMNNARHAVGLEGVAIGEAAYQKALRFARERVQGKPLGFQGQVTPSIIEHADVKRMLMTMRASVDAMRALTYVCAMAFDLGREHPDASTRDYFRRRGDLLTPIVKGWCTETGQEIASLGIQVHGGMGFIEETGAAQIYRDARITTIYEGTTGIQAQDLVGRKTLRDGGKAVRELITEIRTDLARLPRDANAQLVAIAQELDAAVTAFTTAFEWLLANQAPDPNLVAAASVHFLKLAGIVTGGWQLARAAMLCVEDREAGRGTAECATRWLASARFFATQILPQAPGLARTMVVGSASVLETPSSAL